MWAERFEGKVEHIFGIQDEIVTGIVGRLGPELLAAEVARVALKPKQNLDAWECVVRALYHAAQQSEGETSTALAYLARALVNDAEDARALGMRAWILVFRAFQGFLGGAMIPTAFATTFALFPADKRTGVTIIFVTHDLDECFELADEMLVLSAGKLIQSGAPRHVLDRPVSLEPSLECGKVLDVLDEHRQRVAVAYGDPRAGVARTTMRGC